MRKTTQLCKPFCINRNGAAMMRRHRRCLAAHDAFQSAADAEAAAKPNLAKRYSPETSTLRDAWHEEMRRSARSADALARRMQRRKSFTWADVTTLLIASWHSVSARRVLEMAVG